MPVAQVGRAPRLRWGHRPPGAVTTAEGVPRPPPQSCHLLLAGTALLTLLTWAPSSPSPALISHGSNTCTNL